MKPGDLVRITVPGAVDYHNRMGVIVSQSKNIHTGYTNYWDVYLEGKISPLAETILRVINEPR